MYTRLEDSDLDRAYALVLPGVCADGVFTGISVVLALPVHPLPGTPCAVLEHPSAVLEHPCAILVPTSSSGRSPRVWVARNVQQKQMCIQGGFLQANLQEPASVSG